MFTQPPPLRSVSPTGAGKTRAAGGSKRKALAQSGEPAGPRLVHPGALPPIPARSTQEHPTTAQTPGPPKVSHKRKREEPGLRSLQVQIPVKTPAVVRVLQSEGAMSSQAPLVSTGFEQCSAIIVRNLLTGNTLVMHHDSGARSLGGVAPGQVSPGTMEDGLIGRDRFHYREFMDEKGDKTVLLVESQRSFDRREVIQRIVADGAMPLPPLLLQTAGKGSTDDEAVWDMVYKPASDELIVHLHDDDNSQVLHFAGLMTGTDPVKLRSESKGSGPAVLNIVEDLPAYKKRLAQGGLSDAATKMLALCLEIVETRNVLPASAMQALTELRKMEGIPPEIEQGLRKGRPLDRDGRLMSALTGLANHCLGAGGSGLHDPLQ